MRDSLDAHLQVLWVARSRAFPTDALEREGVAWREAEQSGQLTIVDPDRVLRLNGEADIPEHLRSTRELVERARAQGYGGLSLGVDIADALSVMPSIPAQLAFERAWEDFTRAHAVWLLCLYGPTVDPAHLYEAVPLHPQALHHPSVTATVADGAIHVRGEIDLSNSRLLRAYLRALLEDRMTVGDVRLDLGQLAFIDLQGVRDLVELQRTHAAARLRLVNPPRSLRRLLDVAGWAGELDVLEASA